MSTIQAIQLFFCYPFEIILLATRYYCYKLTFSLFQQMKSTDVDQGLFTDSYCRVCSAQLISESQRVAHYEVRKTPIRQANNMQSL